MRAHLVRHLHDGQDEVEVQIENNVPDGVNELRNPQDEGELAQQAKHRRYVQHR